MNRRTRLIDMALVLIIMLLITCILIVLHNNKEAGIQPLNQPVDKITVGDHSSDLLLTEDEMKEDLDYLVATLQQVHPSLIEGWSEEQTKAIDEVYNLVSKQPLPAGRFFFLADTIVTQLHDAHTNISPFSASSASLNLPLYWTPEGPVALHSTPELQQGDLLLELGGLTPPQLLNELSKVISAENDNWVKVMGIPMLASRAFLDHLNLLENGQKVKVKVLRDQQTVELNLPLVGRLNNRDMGTPYDYGGSMYNYAIDERLSLGVLRINTCEVNDAYLQTLTDFFNEIRVKGIKRVAIDLRNNTGGNSSVVDEFMRYLAVDEYQSYGSFVRFSSQSANTYEGTPNKGTKRHAPAKIPVMEKVEHPFTGDLYVLTSGTTFSSGNWFAVILKDNGLATVIGEPTGNQPSSYGDILTFTLPHSGYNFSVSFKQFTRPDIRLNDKTFLSPDIPVYTSRQDIIDRRDAQLEKLKELIAGESTK